jgi:hypothetical protein
MTGRGPVGLGGIRGSDHHRQLVEGRGQDEAGQRINPEFVVASTDVLDECVARHDDAGRPVPIQAAHWLKPGLQPPMVGLYAVVGVLGGVVECVRQELGDRAS